MAAAAPRASGKTSREKAAAREAVGPEGRGAGEAGDAERRAVEWGSRKGRIGPLCARFSGRISAFRAGQNNLQIKICITLLLSLANIN